MNTAGDLLILFDPARQPPAGRLGNLDWRPCADTPSAWLQCETAEWKGFPLHMVSSPAWDIFALGDARLQVPAGDEADAAWLTRQAAGQQGSFLVFAWDHLRREWHAWTDRFGSLHAYHAWDGRRAALGTFSPGVAEAASRKVLDWGALAGWFSFGFFPADRTHFTDLRILRPASHTVFSEQGLLLRQGRYWEWTYNPDEKRSYDDTVAQFGEVFDQVMQDALQTGRLALPLSGGLDSRTTAAAIPPALIQEGRVWSYSYGYGGGSAETRIARRVAEARGLPFSAYTIPEYLFGQVERLLAYTEGFQDITQARQMAVRNEIASHADVLIAALWGDIWMDEMGLAGRRRAEVGNDGIVRHTLKKMRKQDGWLLEQLVLPQLGLDTAEPLLEEFVRSELRKLWNISSPDFQVKAYKTEQWSFRWSIPPTRVFQSAAWPRKVFYDTRLADFFCTVPVETMAGRRLQIDYLKRFAPDLARLPWQVYDADLYHYRYFNTLLLPKRILKKGWRLARRERVVERNWEVQFLGASGPFGLERWLTEGDLRLHEFIAPRALAGLLDDFYRQPSPALAYPLGMLLTFSAWLEMYG